MATNFTHKEWNQKLIEELLAQPYTDVDFRSTYRVKNLAAPTSGGALRKGSRDVSLAEVETYITQKATVTLTIAQIKALFTTAIEIVAAPGAGKYIQFLGCIIEYDYAAVYTITSVTDFQVKYTDKTGAAVSVTRAVTGIFDQTADVIYLMQPLSATALIPVANAKLVMSLAGADPTGTGSPVHVTTMYRVFDSMLVA